MDNLIEETAEAMFDADERKPPCAQVVRWAAQPAEIRQAWLRRASAAVADTGGATGNLVPTINKLG